MFDKKQKLTATQVCYLLNISARTLDSWYKYINETPKSKIPASCPGLPAYEQAHARAPRFWSMEHMHQLYAFQKWLPRGNKGVMGHINMRYWGKRYHNPKQ